MTTADEYPQATYAARNTDTPLGHECRQLLSEVRAHRAAHDNTTTPDAFHLNLIRLFALLNELETTE